jgi:CRP-like cAMP-binding protein
MTVYENFPDIEKLPFFKYALKDTVNKYLTENTIKVISFSHGNVIYSPVSKELLVGILIDGIAKVRPNGDERTLLKTLRKGEIFGIANLYAEDACFPSVVIAEKKATVMFIDGEAFKRFIENDPSALNYYLRFLSQKIVYLNKKIATFAASSAESKLALYLTEYSSENTFSLSISMSELAKTLGLGRASLYRALDKLVASDLIQRDGANIQILNREDLLALASNDIIQF